MLVYLEFTGVMYTALIITLLTIPKLLSSINIDNKTLCSVLIVFHVSLIAFLIAIIKPPDLYLLSSCLFLYVISNQSFSILEVKNHVNNITLRAVCKNARRIPTVVARYSRITPPSSATTAGTTVHALPTKLDLFLFTPS